MGLFDDVGLLLSVIKSLAALDLRREWDAAQAALTMLASISRSYREELLGLLFKLPAAAAAPSEEVSANVLHACKSFML